MWFVTISESTACLPHDRGVRCVVRCLCVVLEGSISQLTVFLYWPATLLFSVHSLCSQHWCFLMQHTLLFNKKAKKNPYFTLPVQHQMENENENDRNVRQVQAGDKIGTPALVHGKPHADRFHVNRFRHANLLPRLTASCYM